MKHYGKSKENRPNPIVTMGLFMDADGIPLAFDIFPGNQNEQTTLKPLEKKIIKDFNCSEFIFCSDAGLGSSNNREFNSIGNRAYVITHSLKKKKVYELDEEQIAKEELYDGFYAVMTNLDFTGFTTVFLLSNCQRWEYNKWLQSCQGLVLQQSGGKFFNFRNFSEKPTTLDLDLSIPLHYIKTPCFHNEGF